jgi:imidazolonepropionase-like amidohydrolase
LYQLALLWLALVAAGCHGRGKPADFVRVPPGTIALTHVRVIDGSGAPSRDDQTVILDGPRIREVGDASAVSTTGIPRILDLHGHTVLPGLVGMHEHLFYAFPPGSTYGEVPVPFARLYLAAGVTSARTGGTLNLPAEADLRNRIEAGSEFGPHLYLTSPYLDPAANSPEDPQAAISQVQQWNGAGARTVKVYTHARPSELAATIATARRLGMQVTGHLCAIGFTQAAELGIDNLEHGLIVDTEFYPGRRPNTCPDQNAVAAELARMDADSPAVQQLIRTLVQHHVAITSTLTVFESFSSSRLPRLDADRTMLMLTPDSRAAYRRRLSAGSAQPETVWATLLKLEMNFERAFVEAGGLLMAGVDPTGWGAALPGYGDQHQLELLVEAGFTPEQAIRIATYNGALFLGQAARIGTLEKGKEADLVIVEGNPVAGISAIRNTRIVFKDGVGFDSQAVLRSVEGTIGQ